MLTLLQCTKPLSLTLFLSLFSWLNSTVLSAQEAEEGTKIMATTTNNQDNFGKSVAVSGNYSVIGAWTDDERGPEAGAAYIYFRQDEKTDHWIMREKLLASDGEAFNNFGGKVAIEGDFAFVTAQGNDDFAGAIYVFQRQKAEDNTWKEVQKIMAPDKSFGDYFGTSITVNNGWIAVGAYGEDDKGRSAGAVYTYQLTKDQWKFEHKILDQEGAPNDRFGSSVALAGNTLVVGANRDNNAGSIIIFERKEKGWNQILKIFSSDGKAKDRFGSSLALSDDYLAVGADGAEAFMGAVYVFERNLGGENNWGELKKIQPIDADTDDRFGKTIAMSGEYLLAGSEGHEMGMGATYLFRKDKAGENNWGLANKMNAMDGSPRDLFGSSVAMSGEDIFIGAYQSDRKGGAYIFRAEDKSIFASKDD